MALSSTEITIATSGGFYVRALYHLYQFLSSHPNYTIIDNFGDWSSEANCVAGSQVTAPWFVAQSDTFWPNSSVTPLYWFGAKHDGYDTSCGLWPVLTLTNAYFLGVLGHNVAWDFGNKDYDDMSRSMWSWMHDSHDNYTGTMWISVDEYTIIAGFSEGTTTMCGLVYHGAFDSLTPNDPYAISASIGRSLVTDTYSVAAFKDHLGPNNKKYSLRQNAGTLDVCNIGINDTEHPTSSTADERGRLQDGATIFLAPAYVLRGDSEEGFYSVQGMTRNLYQITRNTSLVANYEKDTANSIIKLPGGFAMKYA
jgi:hypothetical protein